MRGAHVFASVGRKPDQPRLLTILLPNQLSEIQLPGVTHVRGPGITEVRVVGPDHGARLAGYLADVAKERLEGFHHVRIAQIPR
jgi:hypothetical protein